TGIVPSRLFYLHFRDALIESEVSLLCGALEPLLPFSKKRQTPSQAGQMATRFYSGIQKS
ncbi:hypothetical protein BC829DRAFT_398738, partial [Chytridium lagenaria]